MIEVYRLSGTKIHHPISDLDQLFLPSFRYLKIAISSRIRGAWVAAHLSSWPTLLLPKDAPPADFPFDAAGSPDATRGATPARTRMASATCPGLTLDGPRLPILGCILANCGAARGEDSLLQSPAECGRMHAPVDSETDLTLAV